MSANPRYRAAQRADLRRPRRGPAASPSTASSGCSTHADTIAPEAACTSVQFHLQVSPDDFARYWNAAQAIAGVQVAVGANSPFLFGKQLWARDPDPAVRAGHRHPRRRSCKAQGVRPRVWFGERWITSIFDLFEENVRYFPALLPICDDEDPVAVLDGRRVPAAGRAAPAQRHDLPLEPAGLRRRRRRAAPAGGEPGAAGRADRRRHARQRRVLLRPGARRWPRRTGRCGARCRSRRPRRTSTPAARHGIDAHAVLAGRWARSAPPSWCCAGCCRWPRTGLDRWGVDAGHARPAARHHRAALPHRPQRRGLADRHGRGAGARRRDRATALRRMLSATSSTCTPTSRCTPGRRPPSRRATAQRSDPRPVGCRAETSIASSRSAHSSTA